MASKREPASHAAKVARNAFTRRRPGDGSGAAEGAGYYMVAAPGSGVRPQGPDVVPAYSQPSPFAAKPGMTPDISGFRDSFAMSHAFVFLRHM